jgi:RNA recognition motif-containing protein
MFGQIAEIIINKSSIISGKSAFIEFKTKESTQKAIDKKNIMIRGRILLVKLSHDEKE